MSTMRMLRRKSTGALFPYTDVLATHPDVEEVIVPVAIKEKGQESTYGGRGVVVTADPRRSVHPGQAWEKNKKGTWQRKKK